MHFASTDVIGDPGPLLIIYTVSAEDHTICTVSHKRYPFRFANVNQAYNRIVIIVYHCVKVTHYYIHFTEME